MPFKKGQSGNPKGRAVITPKMSARMAEGRRLVAEAAPEIAARLLLLAESEDGKVAVAALRELGTVLERMERLQLGGGDAASDKERGRVLRLQGDKLEEEIAHLRKLRQDASAKVSDLGDHATALDVIRAEYGPEAKRFDEAPGDGEKH